MNSKLIINGIIIALVVISVVSAFYIFRSQGRGLDLEFEAPEEVLGGTPFDLKVNFSNNSGTVLQDARLTLTLPDGAEFFGMDTQKTIDNKSIGNIGVGSLIQQSYKIIVFSPDVASKEFKAAINYAPESLGARFEKSRTVDVIVRSSGITVELTVPEKIVSGEEFEVGVTYRNVSDIDFSDLELKLEYPANFFFVSSSLNSDQNNNIWRLGDLRKNSDGKFAIKGSLIGGEGESSEFKSELSTHFAGQEYLINKSLAKIIISSSPLSLSIHLNGNSDYVARRGDDLNYTISYINGTDAALKNVVVKTQLIGEMFDVGTIQSQGFFRSADNTLIWNSDNNSSLASLPPGSAGVINFNLKTKDNYPVKRFSDKNFILRVNVEAESPTVPDNFNSSRIFSRMRLDTKVSGDLMVDAKAYFRDAQSGILNRGQMPPKVGQPTNFTIHWLLKDFGSDVSNVEVRSVLGNNVKMVGDASSNVGSAPLYDPATNEIIWRLDKIQANQGVIGNPIEAIFQIEAIPLMENVGNYMSLMGPLNAIATDEFTGKQLNNIDGALTTALSDDPTIGQQDGVVQP